MPARRAAHVWAGLMIVEASGDGFWPDRFEIWHEPPHERLLLVDAAFERARTIATALAGIADWTAMSTTDDLMIQARVMSFGIDHPREVTVQNRWTDPAWDMLVPYGRSNAPTEPLRRFG